MNPLHRRQAGVREIPSLRQEIEAAWQDRPCPMGSREAAKGRIGRHLECDGLPRLGNASQHRTLWAQRQDSSLGTRFGCGSRWELRSQSLEQSPPPSTRARQLDQCETRGKDSDRPLSIAQYAGVPLRCDGTMVSVYSANDDDGTTERLPALG